MRPLVVRKRKTCHYSTGTTDSPLFQQEGPLQTAWGACLQSPQCLYVQKSRNTSTLAWESVSSNFYTALCCFITWSGGCNIPGQHGLSNTSNFLTAQEAGKFKVFSWFLVRTSLLLINGRVSAGKQRFLFLKRCHSVCTPLDLLPPNAVTSGGYSFHIGILEGHNSVGAHYSSVIGVCEGQWGGAGPPHVGLQVPLRESGGRDLGNLSVYHKFSISQHNPGAPKLNF